jgi:hypothetical protein
MVSSALNSIKKLGLPGLIAAGALVLAGASGFLTSTALGLGSATPAKTVTINVATGSTGPAGPQGPTGPAGPPGQAGGFNCPDGFSGGYLIINHPGGHTTLYTCLED